METCDCLVDPVVLVSAPEAPGGSPFIANVDADALGCDADTLFVDAVFRFFTVFLSTSERLNFSAPFFRFENAVRIRVVIEGMMEPGSILKVLGQTILGAVTHGECE